MLQGSFVELLSLIMYLLSFIGFPVEQRIKYELLLLAFKSVNNKGLSYLSDLLGFYIPSQQLHSSSDSSPSHSLILSEILWTTQIHL